MAEKKKKLILIAGPTAVGKTAIAIKVATQFETEIISADSRQCYKELSIGVARPSASELAAVQHHFIASHSIHEKINAVSFEKYALEKLEQIFAQKDIAIVTGGTGLYIKALTEGMDEIPFVPQEVHEDVVHSYKQQGMQWLQQQVRELDPLFYKEGEILNPQRMMRALEVYRTTGKSILHFRKGEKSERNFDPIKIALHLPRQELHRNISARVDKMMEQGLLDEVSSLMPFQHLNALQTVGYKELFDYLNGEISLGEAVELIKKNTRQYAKRQMTWSKKDKEYTWLDVDAEELLRFLKTALNTK